MKTRKWLAGLAWFSSCALASGAGAPVPLEPGDPAPRLSGINQDGETIQLGDLYETADVLVFFYPRASTSGCTAQACSLRDAFAELESAGVTVVGVSTDSIEAQKRFHDENNLPYPLVADPEGAFAKAFRVPLRHSGDASFAARQAFLIRDGVIVWRDLQASTAKQAEDVLAFLSRPR